LSSDRHTWLLLAYGLLFPCMARASGGYEDVGVLGALAILPVFLIVLGVEWLTWTRVKNAKIQKAVGVLILITGSLVGLVQGLLLLNGLWERYRNYDPYLGAEVWVVESWTKLAVDIVLSILMIAVTATALLVAGRLSDRDNVLPQAPKKSE
jgi:hypothetical protein